MTSRAMSELLLVGSLPAESTDAALRAGSELFGDMVFALPDGETGPRAAWAGYHQFRALREEGVIPAHLRFQVGLPFPSSALNAFKADFAADLFGPLRRGRGEA